MLKKTIIGVLAAVTAFVAIPTAAEAQYYRDGYYSRDRDGYRHRRHRPRTRVYVQTYYPPAYYGGYYGPGYYDSYYGPYPDRYRNRYYRDRYYRGRYYRSGYYGRRYRCDDGVTGAIVGGTAGALIGREIGRDGRRGRYGRYGNRRGGGTTGAILGGALGALVGREATRC